MASQTPSSSSVSRNGPTTQEQMIEQIQLLQQEVIRLQAVQQSKVYKIDKPGPYTGTKGTLQGFLTQCRAYLQHYAYQFASEAEKVVFVGHRLEGDALTWFEPTLRDY